MTLSERQEEILRTVVMEYIATAEPVSSQAVEERSKLSVSPATIRSELQALCEEGYLLQPHISSGRVPTDKGYRFVVNEIIEQRERDALKEEKLLQDADDLHAVTQELAEASSYLVMARLEDAFFKDGWEGVLEEPEFTHRDIIGRFTHFLRDVEKQMDALEPSEHIDIYIGEENPFSQVGEFSILLSPLSVAGRQQGVIALIGPKRMRYQKNINLLESLET